MTVIDSANVSNEVFSLDITVTMLMLPNNVYNLISLIHLSIHLFSFLFECPQIHSFIQFIHLSENARICDSSGTVIRLPCKRSMLQTGVMHSSLPTNLLPVS